MVPPEFRQPKRKAPATQQLHAEEAVPVMPADFEDRHDIGMVKARNYRCLADESLSICIGS